MKKRVLAAAIALSLVLTGCGFTDVIKDNPLTGLLQEILGDSSGNTDRIRESGNRFEPLRVSLNRGFIEVTVDGEPVLEQAYPTQIGENGRIYVPEATICAVLGAHGYWENGSTYCLESARRAMRYGKGDLKMLGETVYIPADLAAESYEVDFTWNAAEHRAEFTSTEANQIPNALPARYDYREVGRASVIKDQGDYGVCWADAGTTAVETVLLPEIREEFSVDHMTYKNAYETTEEDGGNELITLAYVTSWTGPVREADDPYGDHTSPDGLAAAYHVQEARVEDMADIETVKRQVYQFGGVESSIYFDLEYEYGPSDYYNADRQSYCCTEDRDSNHSIVIIGWDDNYPADAFVTQGIGDGAFICQNSWGNEFADGGIFYVSYYDKSLGDSNVTYSSVESAANYAHIFQSDLCGWTGSIGYEEQDYGWLANVYTAVDDAALQAVSFYALGKETTYEVFVLTEEDAIQNLREGELKARDAYYDSCSLYYEAEDSADLCWSEENIVNAVGRIRDPGYYTVPLSEPVALRSGQEYAVILRVQVKDNEMPLAIEWSDEDAFIDITDGEGYMSSNGIYWIHTEEEEDCNVCLKAFTK